MKSLSFQPAIRIIKFEKVLLKTFDTQLLIQELLKILDFIQYCCFFLSGCTSVLCSYGGSFPRLYIAVVQSQGQSILEALNNHLGIHIALQQLTTKRVFSWFCSNFRELLISALCFPLVSSPAGIQSFKECGYAVLLITNDFYYLLPHCVQMGESSAQVLLLLDGQRQMFTARHD